MFPYAWVFSAFPVFSVRTEIVHDTCIVYYNNDLGSDNKKIHQHTGEEGAGALCDYVKKTSPVHEKKISTPVQHVLTKEICYP